MLLVNNKHVSIYAFSAGSVTWYKVSRCHMTDIYMRGYAYAPLNANRCRLQRLRWLQRLISRIEL